MGPNKIYELIVTIINALGVAFTDADKQALFTALPFVINRDNGYANDCSMNSIYKNMTLLLEISRSAAESRLRRALNRLAENVDRCTYQNIFMRKENVGADDIAKMSQHDLLYCVVEYVVDEIQKELSGPAKNDRSPECACDCEGEPDHNPSPQYEEEPELDCGDEPSGHSCRCCSGCERDSCCCEEAEHESDTGCEGAANCHLEEGTAREWAPESGKNDDCKEHVEVQSEPVVCHTRYPFEDGDGITKKGIISHVLSQFQLPFICHTKEQVIKCLMCLIGDTGEVVEFTYYRVNPDFTFLDKVFLFSDILSFEVDLFAGLTKEEMYEYFGKKTKFFLMKPSKFLYLLANLISTKYINQLRQEGRY